MILTCLVLIVSVFFLPESPKYLINKNLTEKARKTLNSIARFNKVAGCEFGETVFRLETVSRSDVLSANKSKSELENKLDADKGVEFEGKAFELCKYKSLRTNLLDP